ncbi:MAG: uL15 family ribosomal protein [Candidatus Woesearchaeota archaeon]|nr:uL15 family ribosomal protein [Candidatus Woesearchaeota archaeon]
MTTHKRKKVGRYRGSQTHGGGAKKKRRGTGNKGGAGRAGTGKRAHCRKPSIWADPLYFGRHGFKIPYKLEKISAVNIDCINEKIEDFKANGIASEKSGAYEIDLSKLGFNKLIGSGACSKKMIIKVKYASTHAVEKVKEAGGEVVLTAEKKEKINKPAKDTIKKETA